MRKIARFRDAMLPTLNCKTLVPVTTIGCNHNKSKITDPSSSLNNFSQLLRVKECAKAVMLTSQANILLVVAALCVCCLHTACTIPIPASQASANSSTISTVVSQVVASLPTGPGRSGTVNATTLTNMIVEGLTEGGLECNGCKKRGEQYFLGQFTQSTQLSGCLSLVKVPLPGNRTYPGSPPPYILTGSTDCLTPRLDSQCFPRNAAPKCTWNQNVRDLGDSVFPRFVVSVNNNNCYTSELRILPVYILKRQDECDSSGNEVWRPIAEKVVVGCSCSRTN